MLCDVKTVKLNVSSEFFPRAGEPRMPYLGYEDEEFPGGRFSRMPYMVYEGPCYRV